MKSKLTIKQEKFTQNLFKGMSQREAYKKSYNAKGMTDKSKDEKACELANTVKVTERIKELTNKLADKTIITVDQVLNELALIAFSDVTDYADIEVSPSELIPGAYKQGIKMKNTSNIDKNKIRAISGLKEGQCGVEIKLNDKVKALELIGKHLAMFTDKTELSGGEELVIKIVKE